MTLRIHPTEIVRQSQSPLLSVHPSWSRVPLGDIAEVRNGFAFKSEFFEKGEGVPLLRIRDVGRNSTEARYSGQYDLSYIVRRGEIVVGMDGDFRVARWGGPEALLNQRVCKIVPRDQNLYDEAFLLYVLPGYLNAIHDFTSSVTVKHLSSESVKEIPLPLPPFAEQRRIVAAIEEHFSRIDAGVEALNRARRNLQRMRAAVLHASVTGRLVPQDPHDEPAEQLVKRVHEERRANWNGGRYREPTAPDLRELPTLPPGWTWATLEQVSMRVTVGHVGPMKNEYVADGVPFLRSQNVRENRFDPNGLVYISREFHERLSKSRLQSGDLVIVRSGSVGTACVVPETLPEANCADLVVVQRPLGFDPRFGAYYMNSLARKYVHSEQVGVALTHFNTRSAASLPIPIPPLSEQARIVEAVERFLSVISDLESTVDSVSLRERRLRQSTLIGAFTGLLVPQDSSDEPASALLERIRITCGGKTRGQALRLG